jgi:hypothetical protein
MVIGLGIMLWFSGAWLASIRSHAPSGWVGYAPLSGSVNVPTLGGIHPWARLVIWLIVIAVWVAASLVVLKDPRQADARESEPGQ